MDKGKILYKLREFWYYNKVDVMLLLFWIFVGLGCGLGEHYIKTANNWESRADVTGVVLSKVETDNFVVAVDPIDEKYDDFSTSVPYIKYFKHEVGDTITVNAPRDAFDNSFSAKENIILTLCAFLLWIFVLASVVMCAIHIQEIIK